MNELVQITRYPRSEFYAIAGGLDQRKKDTLFEPQLPLRRLTKYVAESVTAVSKLSTPDCQTCGICCDLDSIVPVGPGESEVLTEYWDVVDDSENEVVIDRVLARDIESGHCVHLSGELKKNVACSIYENRPHACRTFEAGSDRCHEYRRMYGLEPQLDDDSVTIETRGVENLKLGLITASSIFVDSVSVSVSVSRDDPERMVASKNTRMKINAIIDDLESEIELHEYNANEETWFESEFVGLRPQDAVRLIESRGRQGVSE